MRLFRLSLGVKLAKIMRPAEVCSTEVTSTVTCSPPSERATTRFDGSRPTDAVVESSREVGLSTGAIFRHFASLDALLEAIVTRVEAVLAATYPPADLPPRERLEPLSSTISPAAQPGPCASHSPTAGRAVSRRAGSTAPANEAEAWHEAARLGVLDLLDPAAGPSGWSRPRSAPTARAPVARAGAPRRRPAAGASRARPGARAERRRRRAGGESPRRPPWTRHRDLPRDRLLP